MSNSSLRRLIRESVRQVIREIGETENVPGGQPPPGAGLGDDMDDVDQTIVVKSITDNGFDIAEDGMAGVTLVTVTGFVGAAPFELVERIRLVPWEEEDADEDGRYMAHGVAAEDGEVVSFKVDGIDLSEDEAHHLLDRTSPGGPEYNAAVVKYYNMLEKRFEKSPEYGDVVDAQREAAAYGADPYKYYGVKRSDFY